MAIEELYGKPRSAHQIALSAATFCRAALLWVLHPGLSSAVLDDDEGVLGHGHAYDLGAFFRSDPDVRQFALRWSAK
eukprot:CAMPEP_0206490774 /NCGR_PEP_ID=MMETSP0324_2-20121206/44403_1 /ASSEMBLY_ACC=CAM_ASM_000836 /TAXON_ID=2866 /ORGANISM="Crypthecodinium cohnii, Strain Seligo" /LENGTH=76 /DNA_ID=CAMNT_0053971443 /DNA_START=183 /DNA_END=413 /DNA_ORIENTATION=-